MMAPYSWLLLAVLAFDATALGSATGVCHCVSAISFSALSLPTRETARPGVAFLLPRRGLGGSEK